MYNRMQFAVIMIAAMLSAWILSGSCHPVLANPIVRSTDGTPVHGSRPARHASTGAGLSVPGRTRSNLFARDG